MARRGPAAPMIPLRAPSIRAQLTGWYTALIGVYLAALGAGGYAFVGRITLAGVDEELSRTAATVATAMEFERSNGAPDEVAIQNVIDNLRLPDVAVVVLDADTRKAKPAIHHPHRPIPLGDAARLVLDDSLAAAVRRSGPGGAARSSLDMTGPPIRLFTLPYVLHRRHLVIGVATVMASRAALLDRVRLALTIAVPFFLALAAAGGYALAARSLAPVAAITERAQEIGAGNLHERLPVRNPHDELGRLVAVLNDLLGRLERSFALQARFVADASHELRTPVAVIAGESDLALSRESRPPHELRQALAVIRDESRRLRSAVDDLFLLARADAGEPMVHRAPVDLAEIAVAAGRAAERRAEGRAVRVDIGAGAHDGARTLGDAELLRRVFDNLLDNAIKYSRPNGPIALSLTGGTDAWHADVIDAGPGVPEAFRDAIFERFNRGDDSVRPREAAGAGLGLSIAREIARAHGGALTLHESGPTRCVFRLSLPAG